VSSNFNITRPETTGRTTAEIRHTLRTPINHLVGYTELLLEDNESPADSRDPLICILACARQSLAAVQKHLQPAREGEGEVPAELGELRCELDDPVRQIIESTDALETIETGTRLSDVRRIRNAAIELLEFASGNLPEKPVITRLDNDAPRTETPATVSARMLVVDDTDLSRELLCRLLEREGHQCIAVATGVEALEVLHREEFDLVLLDLMMPGMNGMETLRAIKSDPTRSETAVVMLSAFDEVGEIGYCLEMGAEDYLIKPFDRVVLKARLNTVLERKRLQNLERRRRLELEMADAELRRSNDELKRFASVVSHDLQEPLRMVTTYMQLLKRDLGSSLTKDQCEYLDYAIDGGKRMSELIRDLLAYSRVSAGPVKTELVDLNEIVAAVKKDLKAMIEESGATIVSSALPTIRAEPLQIRQLFQNLCSNAIKYRSERPPVVKITAERSGEFWLFSITDNGLGIDPANRQRIFEMFSRLDDRSVPGTGIGLAICQRVIETVGGRIWVESEPGKGSTFFFTVPAAGRS
jgi:light-regulated signal transduction histidine kinase (bacteriophytochrome)